MDDILVCKSDVPVKLVTEGDCGVGKTSLLITYETKNFPLEYCPTVFDNNSVYVTFNEHAVDLDLWDTAGEEEYEKLRPITFSKVDVFIICYSITSTESLESVEKKWIPEINLFSPNTPFIIVGTKSDLRDEKVISKAECCGGFVLYKHGKKKSKELACEGIFRVFSTHRKWCFCSF